MDQILSRKDRYIIGLTGNIGTGKSLVRSMLQHLGAFGIDTDMLAHEALRSDSPVLSEIIRRFGSIVVDRSGQLNRTKIANIVFKDKNALSDLEGILHPLIFQASKNLIQRSRLPIIVIEAIKLLESDLVDLCDSIWMVDANEEIIIDRLITSRGMTGRKVIERLSTQSPPKQKRQRSDVVIENDQLPFNTWQMVVREWEKLEQANEIFRDLVKKTLRLTSYFRKNIVLPQTTAFSNIERLFSSENRSIKSISWLSENDIQKNRFQDLRQQDLIRLALSNYFLIPQISQKVNAFSIWDLSQFDLTLYGYYLPDLTLTHDYFQTTLKIIEVFGIIHLVQRINIPKDDYLKERRTFFRELGYNSINAGDASDPQRNMAGYNSYTKNISDGSNLFSS